MPNINCEEAHKYFNVLDAETGLVRSVLIHKEGDHEFVPYSVPVTFELIDSTITVTTTPVRICDALCSIKIRIQNSSTNRNVLIGNSVSQHMVIYPKESLEMYIDDPSKIYIKSASGSAVVNCLVYC